MEAVILGIAFTLFWAIMGGLIGAKKGRPVIGFLASLFCGPLGVIAVLIDKGNRLECPSCRELTHRDASICPHCQREISRSPYFESLDDHHRSRIGIMAVILAVLVVVAGTTWFLINSNALNGTKSKASTKPHSSTSTAADSKPQARRRITRKQFDQLRENMLYSQVVMILGFEGEMVSEMKIPDRLGSDVLYRWVNPDGSMVMVTFRRLDMSKSGVSDVLMSETISSIGLAD